MQDIKELSLEELQKVLKNWGDVEFHAKQIFSWIYKKDVKDFAAMTDLPFDLRDRLKDNFYIFGLELSEKLKSKDGTEKFLFRLRDGNLIEGVCIPAEKRITACISTQAGCKFACRFCASGMSGFKRNLTSGEILEEVLFLKSNSENKKLTHIVFMGTGEPLDNYDSVLKAIRIIKSADALNIGARHITISTSGIIPGIKRLADEDLQVELSVSLHAAEDKLRSYLLPINKKYPLPVLIKACKEYIRKTNRQVTFEYILIKGVNSDLKSARELCKLLIGEKLFKVNIISANTVKELKVEPPDKQVALLFRDYLLKHRVNVTLRKPRGQDIEAACGQLRLRYEKLPEEHNFSN